MKNLGLIEGRRRDVVRILDLKFPGQVTADVPQLIETQETPSLLDDWFDAVTALTWDDFLNGLRR